MPSGTSPGRDQHRVTLQDLIFKLSEYWSAQGCLIQQPLDLEVGAGTMSPETFLRVLGPTHWNVAYVQPSRRPADGRYGENPNRLYKHHQFQVILKPAPDEVQHLYLQSLEACGINIEQHDIRFEEDNWESPTLGAWGIGWQVLFDGLEITQFTYFQQAGGQELSPISAELTYGLERLAMVLQKVDNVYDLEWAPGVPYRDVRFRDEVEQSKFAFGEVTGPRRLQHRLDEAEPRRRTRVREVERARDPGARQASQRRRQVGGERRAAPLVVDERELAVRVGGEQVEHRAHDVATGGPAHPGGPHDRPHRAARPAPPPRRRASNARRRTAGRSRPTRRTGGPARPRTRSRSTGARGGPPTGGTPRRPSGRRARCRPRPLGVGLAVVDRRPRPAVHDDVRRGRQHGAEHGVAVADVEGGPVGSDDLVARPRRTPGRAPNRAARQLR